MTDEASTLVVAFDLAFEVDDDMGLDVAVVVEEAQRPIFNLAFIPMDLKTYPVRGSGS
mgnify:CR=1 FL=1